MSAARKINFPLKVALPMIWNYIRAKISEQVSAVAFIIIYLVVFKLVVLQSAPENAIQVAFGVGMVVFGLAMFLEGLFLGLMPLGERVGVQLPQKSNIVVIMLFGLFLGFGATLAEPSISTLRLAGEGVTPWSAPLLYRFLELDTNLLVWSIGGGVGVAVALGMARFYFGFPLKGIIFVTVTICLGMSVWFAFDDNLKYIINLAWDTGGVTTGPVTVPLVLAMGIGISKASGKGNSAAASGLGVVTLASLFPVLGVFAVAMHLNTTTLKPISEMEFFSKSYRTKSLEMIKTEEALEALAFQRGSSAGRISYYGNQKDYKSAVLSLLEGEEASKRLLGGLSVSDWISNRASEEEKKLLSEKIAEIIEEKNKDKANAIDFLNVERGSSLNKLFKSEVLNAVFAVVPLVLLLLLILVFLLRDKLKRADEAILGFFLCLFGMCVLTIGIRLGLSSLGNQIGKTLPRVYKSEAQESGRFVFKNFDKEALIKAYNTEGQLGRYFYITDNDNNVKTVLFDESRYDENTGSYEYIRKKEALWTSKLSLLGIAFICLFAFGMGYGSTVAEPALNALAITVEDMTVGTVKRTSVVGTVSVGVGTGLIVGVLRLIGNIPACWLLVPGYIVSLILTYFCDEEFAGLAWDSGGVTTGPITVPLILAIGLGIGGGLNVVDGFGIVSMASLFPILTMLIFGINIRKRQNIHLQSTEEGIDEK